MPVGFGALGAFAVGGVLFGQDVVAVGQFEGFGLPVGVLVVVAPVVEQDVHAEAVHDQDVEADVQAQSVAVQE